MPARPPMVGRATPTAPPDRATRRADLALHLLGAMNQLLAEGETFHGVSIQRLIDAAGVTRGLFYAYFANKRELLLHWGEHVMRANARTADDWLGLDAPPSTEHLAQVLERVIDGYLPHAQMMAAVFDGAAYDEELRELAGAMLDHYTQLMARHLATGQAAGWVDPTLDPGTASGWLVLLLEPVHDPDLRHAAVDDRRRRIRALAVALHATIYRPAAPGT